MYTVPESVEQTAAVRAAAVAVSERDLCAARVQALPALIDLMALLAAPEASPDALAACACRAHLATAVLASAAAVLCRELGGQLTTWF